MKRKDMSPSNIHMITTYLESKINRTLTPEEEAMIEEDLLNNYEVYEYPEAEIAELMEAKYNLNPRGDEMDMAKEEAIEFVQEKEEEGYETDLYDDGNFDGFLDAIEIVKDLLHCLTPSNVPVYKNFISSMEEIEKVYDNLHANINRRDNEDAVEKALNRKLTQEESSLIYDELKKDWLKIQLEEGGPSQDEIVNMIIKKYGLAGKGEGNLRVGTASPVLNKKINDARVKLFIKTDNLLYDISQELRKNNFETVREVEDFFMDLIQKDARVPTDHQFDRLTNLAKVLVDIPKDVLIRHYESIMEDEPLKDR